MKAPAAAEDLVECLNLIESSVAAYVAEEANWQPYLKGSPAWGFDWPPKPTSQVLLDTAFLTAATYAMAWFIEETGHESVKAENPNDPHFQLVLRVSLDAAANAVRAAIKQRGTGRITGVRALRNMLRERALATALLSQPGTLAEAYARAGVSKSAGKRILSRRLNP